MSDMQNLPADYAIDALSLEAERRRKARGLLRYSYGDLVADTTQEEREAIAEDYKKRLNKARRKGGYRVSSSAGVMPEPSGRELEDAICQKLESE